MIEIKNLTVGFGTQPVIDGIDITIEKGMTTVIAGPSGTGKSVLMKTVIGLIQPWTGSVAIEGKDVFSSDSRQLKEIRRQVQMLFQSAALFDSMNVFQNIALPLVEHTRKKAQEIREIVAQRLEMVGLPGIGDKMPSELSGGMRKRVGLARAIVLNPAYIIYDEPTTGLDPVIAGEIINLILQMRNELNITSIVITHDLDCINRVAERLIMLKDRRVKFDGTFTQFLGSDDPDLNRFKLTSLTG